MDTETTATQKLPALRTYAKDLEAKRKEKGLAPEAAVSQTTTPMPHAAAAKEVQTKPAKVGFFKRAPKEPVAAPAVTPLPPLSSIPQKQKPAPLPKIVATETRETSFIVDNEDAASATIITDTKRDRFKLFPAIIASIQSWFSNKKKSYAAKKAPKYTVPETTRRKGVIQKATSKTGKFTSSDFESIQERIRQRKEAEEKPESKTTWSANTEPGFPLLEGEVAEPKVTNVQVVAKKSFRAPLPKPTEPTPQPITVSVVKKVTPPETPVTPEPIPVPAAPAPEPETPAEEVAKPEPVTEVTSDKSSFSLLNIRTNLLAVGFAGLVLALTLAGLYGYFVIQPEVVETVTVNNQPTAHFTASEFSSTALPVISGQTITEALEALRVVDANVTETVFVHNNTGEPIAAHLLFTGMKLTIPRDFAQAVADARFGFVQGNPYLYLGIKDEIAARGGLLTWEADLYDAFREIFATTLMPEDATSSFIDGSLGGRDVRVLTHTNGQELLLYTLVDGGVIITTSGGPLTALLNQQP